MRHTLLALVAASLLPLAAHAAPIDNFSITGTQSNSNPFSLAFQLPSSYPAPVPAGVQTVFSAVPILVNGSVNETGTITISTTQFLIINLADPNFDNFAVNTGTPFETLSNGVATFTPAPTDAAATYINCSVKLVKPRPTVSPVLAALQFPTFSLTCPAVSNLAISQGIAAPTPEPASFTLLLLGGLASAGTLYRRVRHTAA